MSRSLESANASGLWLWFSVLASVGAVSGSIVAVIVHELAGAKLVGAVAVGLGLALSFIFLLHRVGLLLANTIFKKSENQPSVESAGKNRLAKAIFLSLLVWFAVFDWIGYSLVRALFVDA